MMLHSRLSCKLSLCKLIGTLNEDECLQVLGWIQKNVGCKSINQLITKIVIENNEWFTNDELEKLSLKIHNDIQHNNTDHIQDKKIDDGKDYPPNDSDQQNSHKSNSQTNEFSPFTILSTDVISKTALFLNQKDIIYFEQCNRLFYQIINNLSFLKQTRNFKTFEITERRLNFIYYSNRCDYYKYCSADKLIFNICPILENPTDIITDTIIIGTQSGSPKPCNFWKMYYLLAVMNIHTAVVG